MNGTGVTKTWLEAQPSTNKRKMSLQQMLIVLISCSLFASLICLLFLEIAISANWIKDKYNYGKALTFIEHWFSLVIFAALFQELRNKHIPQTVGPTSPIIVIYYEISMKYNKALAHYGWKYLVVDKVCLIQIICFWSIQL